MSKSKKTVVIGASSNPSRYAYVATNRLKQAGHEVVPVGLRTGMIGDVEIHKDFPEIEDVDTVTLYVGPKNQDYWKDYIYSLNPKRVIFNPGTESEFQNELEARGIEATEACTLVLLSIDEY